MSKAPKSQSRVRMPMQRGADRPICDVACPCGWHFYSWRDRTWRMRSRDGVGPGELVAEALVPGKCRRAFGRDALRSA